MAAALILATYHLLPSCLPYFLACSSDHDHNLTAAAAPQRSATCATTCSSSSSRSPTYTTFKPLSIPLSTYHSYPPHQIQPESRSFPLR